MIARSIVTLLLLAFFLPACASLEGTFGSMKPDFTDLPADELRTVAGTIEAAIAAGQRDPIVSPSAEVNLDSEAVQQAIRSRAARFELVDGFLDTGFAWEKRDGTLWIIRNKEYAKQHSGRDKDREAMLVNGENGNRWTLYEEIRKLNQWPPSSLGAIQLIFHEARVQNMSPGQKYEDENGEPVER